MKYRLLLPLYDRAASGLPVLGKPTIRDTSGTDGHSPQTSVSDERVDRLINRYVAMSSATGFAFGLPGYAAMPLTIPSNIGALLLIQCHLCATLAATSGRDPQEDAVREKAIECILNSQELEILSSADVEDREASGLADRLVSKLSERGARLIGELATGWIQKAVSRAARSSGILRPRNLPLLGGAVGAINDGASTRAVGRSAQRAFLSSPADQPSTE